MKGILEEEEGGKPESQKEPALEGREPLLEIFLMFLLLAILN